MQDPIFELIEKERQRQTHGIELIASENFVSENVMKAMGSVLTNKYAEGYPGRRYYGGCEFVDEIEQTAINRAKELFGAEHINVQPLSGAPANIAASTSRRSTSVASGGRPTGRPASERMETGASFSRRIIAFFPARRRSGDGAALFLADFAPDLSPLFAPAAECPPKGM